MIKISKVVFVLLLLFIASCAPSEKAMEKKAEGVVEKVAVAEKTEEAMKKEPTTAIEPVVSWRQTQLKDVRTGQNFKVSDFAGKKVLLESFAVWCPKCKQQQDEFVKFKQEMPDVILVSLDTDPNEDEARVKDHIEKYSYNWYFAISPAETTKVLIDDFGLEIVSAPATPVILVCEDQAARFLKSGIKDVAELKQELAKGC